MPTEMQKDRTVDTVSPNDAASAMTFFRSGSNISPPSIPHTVHLAVTLREIQNLSLLNHCVVTSYRVAHIFSSIIIESDTTTGA